MGKRSNFTRRERDTYDTPASAVAPLLPHLKPRTVYAEPCAGRMALAAHLEDAGHYCVHASDIAPRHPDVDKQDMLKISQADPSMAAALCVITNPPWERKLLHAFLLHLREIRMPAWLLLDSSWMFTQQAAAYLPYVSCIVAVGRVKWIDGSKHQSLDDVAWYFIQPYTVPATLFFGKEPKHDSQKRSRPRLVA